MTGIQLVHMTGLCDLCRVFFFFAHLSSALCDDFFPLFYYAHSGSEFNWLLSKVLLAIPMARSKEIAPHVRRLSCSQVYDAVRGLYKGLKISDKPASEIVREYVEKSIGNEKNGGKHLVPTTKAPHFYRS